MRSILTYLFLIFVLMSSFDNQLATAKPVAAAGDQSVQNQQSPVEALPSPGGSEAGSSDAIKLTVNGDKLDLDGLGPMIVNADGTVRRISNWEQLTAREKEVAWRRIAKRNQERIEELKAAGVGVGEAREDGEQEAQPEEVAAIEDGNA
jgi:hypothetical protein